MTSAPIVLVPGFWLGAWAWGEVADALRSDGHEVTPVPLPSHEELAAEENLDGLTEEQLETFRKRAVPEPGAALRDASKLTNEARLDVPSIVVCTGFTSEQVKDAVKEGYSWLGGLTELRDVTYVDLPTSHWPMWSRPMELAEIIGDVAKAHAPTAPSNYPSPAVRPANTT